MEFFFFEVNPRWIRKRIIRTDLIDEASAARCALVGDDDSVERMLLRTVAGEPDGDTHCCSFRWMPAQPGISCEKGLPPPGLPSLVSFFIIFLVCAYCFKKRLTSA